MTWDAAMESRWEIAQEPDDDEPEFDEADYADYLNDLKGDR